MGKGVQEEVKWRSEDSVGKAPVKSRSFRLFITHQLKVRPVTKALRAANL